jgi:hypothetical protein
VAECASIAQPDRGALFHAQDRYAKGEDAGFVVKDYSGGLLMLKKARMAGRCLFFPFEEAGEIYLIFLLAFKKESDEAPAHLIETARERRGNYIESRRSR